MEPPSSAIGFDCASRLRVPDRDPFRPPKPGLVQRSRTRGRGRCDDPHACQAPTAQRGTSGNTAQIANLPSIGHEIAERPIPWAEALTFDKLDDAR